MYISQLQFDEPTTPAEGIRIRQIDLDQIQARPRNRRRKNQARPKPRSKNHERRRVLRAVNNYVVALSTGRGPLRYRYTSYVDSTKLSPTLFPGQLLISLNKKTMAF